MNVTKKSIANYLKLQLSTNSKWASIALVKVLQNQTSYEQTIKGTVQKNNVGFTSADAAILTSIAQYYMQYQCLSERQLEVVFDRMPKYWRQILAVSDINRLKLQTAFHELNAA